MGRLVFIFLLVVGTIWSPADGMVYFGSGDGHLYSVGLP